MLSHYKNIHQLDYYENNGNKSKSYPNDKFNKEGNNLESPLKDN